MIRKIIFSLIILLSIGLIVFYLINQTRAEEEVVLEVQVSAVPSDAVAIMEINNIIDSWHEINDGNLFYEELLGLESIQTFDSAWQLVDSNFFKNPNYQRTFDNKTLTYSLHPVGPAFNYLLTIPMESGLTKEVLNAKLKEIFPGVDEWKSREYENAEIIGLTQGELQNFCTHYRGFFIWSPSSILVENAIRAMDSGGTILQNEDYLSLKKTASVNKNIHLFLDYDAVPSLLSKYVKSHADKILNLPLGGWSEFDLGLKPSSMLLNGYLLCPDSLNFYLNCFNNQDPGEISLTEIMPYNTAWYLHANISDPNSYLQWNIDYWSKRTSAKKMLESREYFINKLQWDPLTFQTLLGEELVLAVIEPNNADIEEDYAIFMQLKDPDEADVMLNGLLDKYLEFSDNEALKGDYRNFEYFRLGKTQLMELAFGPFFKVIDNPYIVVFDDNMAIANSFETLKSIINHYRADQTLAKDIHYNKFMGMVAEESNLSIYSNIARAPYYYKNMLKENKGKFIDEELEMFRQFQAVSIQYEKAKDHKYYQTLYCKYNPIYKKETTSLWELTLDTTFSGQPFDVINHTNDQKEIFFQDDREDLYLVGNTGKIIWKKKFEGAIIGEPVQIDRYQNKKLQMLFLTPTHIHLLDRNGHDVEGFPIQLPDSASSQLALMDYDKNNRWRLLIGCDNGNVYNYDISGAPVEGWAFGNGGIPVVGVFEHFSISGKDYVLLGDDSGKIQLVNRRGEVRYNVAESVNLSSDYFVIKRKSIDNTAIIHVSENGEIFKSTFGGESELLVDQKHDEVEFFKLKDELRILGIVGDQVMVYDQNGSVIMEFVEEESLTKHQLHFNVDVQKIYLSGINEEGLVFLYDQNGNLVNGFPLAGTSNIKITNINKDQYLDLIIGDNEGMFYSYTLGI